IEEVVSQHNGGYGIYTLQSTGLLVDHSYFSLNVQGGGRLASSEPTIIGTTFENNSSVNGSAAVNAQLFIEQAGSGFLIESCHFEAFNQVVSKTAITL